MWFSSKQRGESIAVIDIGSASVGGALVHSVQGASPQMVYSARVALGEHDSVAQEESMLRALAEIGDRLVREGAPQLRQISGSGSIDRVIASVSSPWQTTRVYEKSLNREAPFTYTKTIELEILGVAEETEGALITESIVATHLNGYRTDNPYGKKASRAEILVLSSSLEQAVVDTVGETLRKLFHTRAITYVGFAIPSYTVLRKLYPHERDMLIVSVTGEETDVASAKRGHLIDVGSIDQGTNALVAAISTAGKAARTVTPFPSVTDAQPRSEYIDQAHNARFSDEAQKAEQEWLSGLKTLLKGFATRHALPHTLFLIADEEVRGFLKQELEDESLRGLWLSDEPPSVIPVLPSQFTPYLTVTGLADGDVTLGMLALYATTNP